MKAASTSGHSSWHKVRKGAMTTYLPRRSANETFWPSWFCSWTFWGVGRLMTRPSLAGGAPGGPLLQAASRATAVIAAPGAAHRFHLCVIAFDASISWLLRHIPPTTTCA